MRPCLNKQNPKANKQHTEKISVRGARGRKESGPSQERQKGKIREEEIKHCGNSKVEDGLDLRRA